MKVSIVTICLNESSKIERTVKSVIEQDYDDIEYILIDGDSKDGTLEIINKYKSKIDVFVSEPDEGIFYAQNKGISLATGDYVIILNAGDYFFKTDSVSIMINNSDEKDFVYGDIVFEPENRHLYRKKSPKKITYLNMFVESIPHPATMYKRTLFKKTGLYDTNYKLSADYDFLLNCIFVKRCSYKYISYPVSVFNLEGVSSNQKNQKLFRYERIIIQKKYFPKIVFSLFFIFSPFIIFFRKKIYYLYFYLKSKFDKKYLEIG
jgi:glycosyltransferase involved in cell wall biosynthesis